MRVSLEKSHLGPLTAVAAALLGLVAAGCGLDKVQEKPLDGPSETGVSVQLSALPDTLNADGVSASVIQLVLRNSDGSALPNFPVYFAHDGDGVISPGATGSFVGPVQTGLVMATDRNGATGVVYTAGSAITTVTVYVRAYNIDGARAFERTVQILQR